MRHLYYPRCETLNCWCWYGTHFHNGAGSLSLLLLPIQEANTSVMTSCNHCPLWLPRMQDLNSLTLRWRSCPGWGREPFSNYFDHKGGLFIQKEQRHVIVNILRLTVRYLIATIYWTTQNAKPEIRPDGWWVRVWDLTAKTHWVGILYGFGTEPKHFSGPIQDHWSVTRSSC